LVEENSYYPHGLKIAALCSKVFDAPSNSSQYQGDFNDFEDETGWNDFELRSYDGQIGSFLQNDPFDQFASPYVGMGNDPVNSMDPSGGWIFSSIGIIEHAAWAIGGSAIGAIIGGATSGWDVRAMKNGSAIGGGIGLGASFINWGAVGGALGDAGSWMGNNIGGLFQTTQYFSSPDDAAKDWGKRYNGRSIEEGIEYGSTIYEDKKGGKIVYRYSKPDPGDEYSVDPSPAPKGKKPVADIHSHGKYLSKPIKMGDGTIAYETSDGEEFDDEDKKGNRKDKINGYVVTPSGDLKKYDYKTRKETLIATDMPSDPNSPFTQKKEAARKKTKL
jgi:RHS repeat-associated protein